jgi:Bacterial dnaA protein helix-turn-helix
MGNSPAPQFAERLVQLVLRARHPDALLQTDPDWQALGLIAARMLFWCGGAIYACRCEGNEMRFALQVAHTSLGAMAHHISGAYAIHVRQTRGLGGGIFKHYAAIPLDEVFLDDLVLWLHRSAAPATTSPISPVSAPAPRARIWTADYAYLVPNSIPWINTDRVLIALSVGAPGPASYRRRKSEVISPEVIELFTRHPQRAPWAGPASGEGSRVSAASHAALAHRPSIEKIARLVADYCQVSYADMSTDTRKRAVSRARAIATVLATRNGATAAAAARLFNRSRSTLIEQVEHYRATQPEIFAEAESILQAFLAEERE